MKALISLHGAAAIDTPKSIINVEYTDEKNLIAKLKDLQSGYSLDGEKDRPKIEKHTVASKIPGKTRKVIDCYTYADWHYVAHIGVSSKKVPTEQL